MPVSHPAQKMEYLQLPRDVQVQWGHQTRHHGQNGTRWSVPLQLWPIDHEHCEVAFCVLAVWEQNDYTDGLEVRMTFWWTDVDVKKNTRVPREKFGRHSNPIYLVLKPLNKSGTAF